MIREGNITYRHTHSKQTANNQANKVIFVNASYAGHMDYM